MHLFDVTGEQHEPHAADGQASNACGVPAYPAGSERDRGDGGIEVGQRFPWPLHLAADEPTQIAQVGAVGELDRAIKDFDQAITIDPKNAPSSLWTSPNKAPIRSGKHPHFDLSSTSQGPENHPREPKITQNANHIPTATYIRHPPSGKCVAAR